MEDFFKPLDPTISVIDPYTPITEVPEQNNVDFGGGGNIDFFTPLNKQLRGDFNLHGALTPRAFDAKEYQLEKFRNSEYFKTFGFYLDRDNEELYGYRQTGWNAFKNGLATMKDLAIYQFQDQLAGWTRGFSMGDLDEANNAFMKSSIENPVFMTKEEQDSIFNMKKFANTLGQAGFTLGTIAEIAFEEAITFGAATALQGTKIGRVLKSLSMFGNRIKDAERVIMPVSKARNWFFKNADNFEKIPFLGNTAKFGAELIGAGRKVGGAGKAIESTSETFLRGFGAFYKDLREYNAATTEARMEAASTYTDLKDELTNHLIDSGKNITIEDLDKIDKIAKEAAATNFSINTAIIGISNKIMFDGVFKGIAGMRAMYTAGNIGNLTSKGVTNFFVRGFNRATLKEGLMKRPLMYFKNNITEALQENFQEASNVAVKAYYSQKYENPASASWKDAIGKGIDSQFTKQGFETFLSGFATGAIVSPITGVVKWGYNKISTSKQERAYKKAQTLDLVKNLNTIFSSEKSGSVSKLASLQDLMVIAAKEKDIKTFQDSKDGLIAETARILIETGQKDAYFSLLDSYKDFTKEEFEQAFPDVSFDYSTKENVSEFIDGYKAKINSIEEKNKRFEYKFGGNPFSTKQNLEFQAWKNAKWHILSTEHAYERVTERVSSIIDKTPDILSGLSAQNFMPLFSDERRKEEISFLEKEIQTLEDGELDEDSKNLLESKKEKVNILKELTNALPSAENENDLTSPIENFLQVIAKENKVTLTKEGIDVFFENIKDIYALNKESSKLIDNLNWVIDPQNVTKFFNEHLDFLKKWAKVNTDNEEENDTSSTNASNTSTQEEIVPSEGENEGEEEDTKFKTLETHVINFFKSIPESVRDTTSPINLFMSKLRGGKKLDIHRPGVKEILLHLTKFISLSRVTSVHYDSNLDPAKEIDIIYDEIMRLTTPEGASQTENTQGNENLKNKEEESDEEIDDVFIMSKIMGNAIDIINKGSQKEEYFSNLEKNEYSLEEAKNEFFNNLGCK